MRTDRARWLLLASVLAAETGCGLQCPLVWQRGEEYDRTVTEMAARIRTALRGGPPSS